MRWLSALSCLALCAGVNVAAGQQPAADPAAKLFGPDKLWTVHLKLTAEAWDKMQPTKGKGMGFPGGPPGKDKKDGPPDKKGGPPDKKGGPGPGGAPGKFGFDFQYVSGTVEFDKETIKNVGIRFKGNSSYGMTQGGLKRPFKLDFNHYVEDQRFHGLTLMSLSNNAFDPSQLREALSYQVFREAGVPAPRTAFVQLYLTVAGKYDRQYLGLYTLIEPVNKPFLKREFGTSKGMLLKPEGIKGLPYFGDDWGRYKDRYQPKSEPTAAQSKRLIAFTHFVNNADDAAFRKDIGSYLEVDSFLRFLAANTLLSNLDSFFGLGHNYFLYLHPKTNRFTFMPWDLNMSFGGFGMAGGSQENLSIKKPFMGPNRLVERVLAMPELEKSYRKHLEHLTKTTFTVAKMHTHLEAMQQVIQPALANEKEVKGGGKKGFGPMMGAPELKPFIEKRVASVTAQLAGKSEGVVPAMGGMFGGPFGRPGEMLAKDLLKNADANKDGKLSPEEFQGWFQKLFQASDPDKKGLVDETMLAAGVEKLLPPPFPGGPKFGPGGKGMKRFNPGVQLAKTLMKRATPDQDGNVTEAKLLIAARAIFQESDTNKSGFLEEQEVVECLNRLMPPPAFGPPGFGPPPMPPPEAQPKEKK